MEKYECTESRIDERVKKSATAKFRKRHALCRIEQLRHGCHVSNYAIVYCCCNTLEKLKHCFCTLYIFSRALKPCLMLICVIFTLPRHCSASAAVWERRKKTHFAPKLRSTQHSHSSWEEHCFEYSSQLFIINGQSMFVWCHFHSNTSWTIIKSDGSHEAKAWSGMLFSYQTPMCWTPRPIRNEQPTQLLEYILDGQILLVFRQKLHWTDSRWNCSHSWIWELIDSHCPKLRDSRSANWN